MTLALITFLITLIIGPLAFWFLSRVYYKHEPSRRFPMSVKGAVGDTVMLPLFNTRAAYLVAPGFILPPAAITLSAVLTVFISLGYLYYRIVLVPRFYQGNNWMHIDIYKDTGRIFNGLGWYHFGYFVLQTFVIITFVFTYPGDIWLWIFLFGYFVTAVVAHYQMKKKSIWKINPLTLWGISR